MEKEKKDLEAMRHEIQVGARNLFDGEQILRHQKELLDAEKSAFYETSKSALKSSIAVIDDALPLLGELPIPIEDADALDKKVSAAKIEQIEAEGEDDAWDEEIINDLLGKDAAAKSTSEIVLRSTRSTSTSEALVPLTPVPAKKRATSNQERYTVSKETNAKNEYSKAKGACKQKEESRR